MSFPNKFKSFPVVESTCDWLSESYNRLKETNFVTKQTCSLAELTLRNSIDLAVTPLLNKFKPQIELIDSMACNQLDRLEAKFPIIKSDKDTIVNQSKELITSCSTIQSIKSCTETLYEYSNLKLQSKHLATKLLELTQQLLEKNLILEELKKDPTMPLLLQQKLSSHENLSLAERSKCISLVVYYYVQAKLINQLNDSIQLIKSLYLNLYKLIQMYDSYKKELTFRLHDKFHVTKDKIDLYKEYLDVLARQFTVQDGRSLEHVHSLEERTKIIIRRSIGNLLTAFRIVYSKLQQIKPIIENSRLNLAMNNLINDIYQILSKDEASFNDYLIRNILNEFNDVITRVDSLMSAVRNYNSTIISWFVPNFEIFGIIDFDDDEEINENEQNNNDITNIANSLNRAKLYESSVEATMTRKKAGYSSSESLSNNSDEYTSSFNSSNF